MIKIAIFLLYLFCTILIVNNFIYPILKDDANMLNGILLFMSALWVRIEKIYKELKK